MVKKLILLVIITLFFVIVKDVKCQDLTAQTTTIVTILVPYEVAYTTYPVITLDNNGNPHIMVLYNDTPYTCDYFDLRHIYWTGTDWVDKTLLYRFTSWFGDTFPGVIFDRTNQMHIAHFSRFYGEPDKVLYYGKLGINTVIDDDAGNISFRCIDVDSSNNPYIVYANTDYGDLKLAKWTGSNWWTKVISPWVIDSKETRYHGSASIKIDHNNGIHIASWRFVRKLPWAPEEDEVVYFYSPDGETFQEVVIDKDAEWVLHDINIDRFNVPYMIYVKDDKYKQKEVLYFVNLHTLSKEIIDESNSFNWPISLEFDSQNIPHICYAKEVYAPEIGYDVINTYLAKKENSVWNKEELIKYTDEISNLKIDNKGAIHLVYIEGNLRYFFRGKVKVEDTIPPAKVQDLAIADCGVTANSVTLTWTAPGDDGNVGEIVNGKYIIVYDKNYPMSSTEIVISTNTKPGARETFTVAGLEQGTEYYFAVKTVDDVGNVSELSNCVNARTLLDVPYFSQGALDWKDEYIVDGDPQKTIGRIGCAMTSLAMIINYYADHHPDTEMRKKILKTDPGALNEWLKKNDGYDNDGNVIFDRIEKYTNTAVLIKEKVYQRNDIKVNDDLKDKLPPILKVKETHFVVAVGSCPAVGYKINDPAWRERKDLEKYNYNYKQIRRFKLGPGDASSLSVRGRKKK